MILYLVKVQCHLIGQLFFSKFVKILTVFCKKMGGDFYMRLEDKKMKQFVRSIAKMKIQISIVMSMDQKKVQNHQKITVVIQTSSLKNQMLKVLAYLHPNKVNLVIKA